MSNATWYFRRTDCQRAPAGTRCENTVIRALIHARAVLGQRRYRLPARFTALTPLGQLLVLVKWRRGPRRRRIAGGPA